MESSLPGRSPSAVFEETNPLTPRPISGSYHGTHDHGKKKVFDSYHERSCPVKKKVLARPYHGAHAQSRKIFSAGDPGTVEKARGKRCTAILARDLP